LRHLAAGERKHFGYNTWFIGFAPKDSPEIAVAVLVQDTALEAGGVAAPIAGRFVEAYFQQKLGQPIRELQAAQEPRKPKAPAGTPVAAVVPQTQ
ncbi:MAG TPA: penicillin-binding transpeptidase domain-containing protein, partial [Candidatus Acidoferrales bacterium]|nr:penicillin-binding transpeptidase domain-containing protein [Candidatus Acidoferrales bacterium]